MAEAIIEYILRAIVFSFRTLIHWLKSIGTGKWAYAEATVTAQPAASHSFAPSVEIIYSYRFEGELYTGLHEQSFFLSQSMADYTARFSNGRKFVVRVKPNEPDVSTVRDEDQLIALEQPKAGEFRP